MDQYLIGLVLITCVSVGVGAWMRWILYVPEQPADPVLDRKARFKLYVEGERRLMAEWEDAFDPPRAALARDMKREMQRAKHAYAITGNARNPYTMPMSPFDAPMFDAYFTPPDRDQCKLEADHMLGMALITAQEYGPRIKRCNKEMQA